MVLQLLDPTNEAAALSGELAPRLAGFAGRRIGIISNGKEGTKGFFAHLERMVREELGAAEVAIRVKSNFSAPADAHIVDEVRAWDAVITGLGD